MDLQNENYLFLKSTLKNDKVVRELISYSENKFIPKKIRSHEKIQSIDIWEEYAKESKDIGVFKLLQKCFVQLQFPIQKNISENSEYKDVVLRGKIKKNSSNLLLKAPNKIQLKIYNSLLIGKIPVIIIPYENDFIKIIQSLLYRNEPNEIPKSMGAVCIKGINNWDKIQRIKNKWIKSNTVASWNNHFKEFVLKNHSLYKDSLIVLSKKPYSNVTYKDLNINKNTWLTYSLKIRLAHECAHLFTLYEYGKIDNNLHDEIIADYAGIISINGDFNKKWFLHFLGLENYPLYRKGGRLENYLGNKRMSNETFDGLKFIVKRIADNVTGYHNFLGKVKTNNDRINRIKTICEVDMLTMASKKGTETLLEVYKSKQQ